MTIVTTRRAVYVTCNGCPKRLPTQATTQAAEEYATANGWIVPVSDYALGNHYCPDCGARTKLLAQFAATRYLGTGQEFTS